jgi:hypothetical protein
VDKEGYRQGIGKLRTVLLLELDKIGRRVELLTNESGDVGRVTDRSGRDRRWNGSQVRVGVGGWVYFGGVAVGRRRGDGFGRFRGGR